MIKKLRMEMETGVTDCEEIKAIIRNLVSEMGIQNFSYFSDACDFEINGFTFQIKDTPLGKVIVDDNDALQKLIGKGEVWDGFLREFYNRYIKKDSVVVDVGAFIGDQTLYLARKASKVYAFEPQKTIFLQLCANLVLNDIKNVIAQNMACGKEVGKCYIKEDPKTNTLASLGFEIGKGDTLVLPLDLILNHEEKVDLIKIDAQGHDYFVIQGCEKVIEKSRPIFLFEYDSTFGIDLNVYRKFFSDRHYVVHLIEKTLCDYLALPVEKL